MVISGENERENRLTIPIIYNKFLALLFFVFYSFKSIAIQIETDSCFVCFFFHFSLAFFFIRYQFNLIFFFNISFVCDQKNTNIKKRGQILKKKKIIIDSVTQSVGGQAIVTLSWHEVWAEAQDLLYYQVNMAKQHRVSDLLLIRLACGREIRRSLYLIKIGFSRFFPMKMWFSRGFSISASYSIK